MPTIPTYGDRQVRTEALRPAFQNTPDVSSGGRALGQGLQNVGEAIDAVALRDDQTKADQADAQITTEWLKWDAENRNKFRGQNADGYESAANEWWKSAAENFGKDLSPRAKSLASRSLVRKQGTALANVAQFIGAEKERFADESAAASISSTIQFGVTSGDVASASQQVREQVSMIGARKGWTTEQVQAEQLKNLSALHLAQITKLAETDAQAAQKYYDANKAEVGFGQQARVEQVLKGEGDNQFAVQFAATNADKPLAEQLKLAGQITDPQRREKTLTQVRNNYALVKQAQQEQEAAASDQAWQLVGQGRRVPEALLAQMDGKGRVQLQEHLKARAEKAAEGKAVKTNPVALARVYDMMRDDPDGFKNLRMESLTTAFSPSDIEQVARIQRDMRKPDKEKDVATTTQLLGTYTGGWKPEKRAVFESAAYDELARYEKDKGRQANYEEKRKLFDRLMLDGEVMSGAWYKNDPNKKLYETTQEERKRFVPSISADDRRLVKEALQAEGMREPTEEQIVQRFKLAKGIK